MKSPAPKKPMTDKDVVSMRLIERLIQKGIPRDEAEQDARDLADARAETDAEFAEIDTELSRLFRKRVVGL